MRKIKSFIKTSLFLGSILFSWMPSSLYATETEFPKNVKDKMTLISERKNNRQRRNKKDKTFPFKIVKDFLSTEDHTSYRVTGGLVQKDNNMNEKLCDFKSSIEKINLKLFRYFSEIVEVCDIPVFGNDFLQIDQTALTKSLLLKKMWQYWQRTSDLDQKKLKKFTVKVQEIDTINKQDIENFSSDISRLLTKLEDTASQLCTLLDDALRFTRNEHDLDIITWTASPSGSEILVIIQLPADENKGPLYTSLKKLLDASQFHRTNAASNTFLIQYAEEIRELILPLIKERIEKRQNEEPLKLRIEFENVSIPVTPELFPNMILDDVWHSYFDCPARSNQNGTMVCKDTHALWMTKKIQKKLKKYKDVNNQKTNVLQVLRSGVLDALQEMGKKVANEVVIPGTVDTISIGVPGATMTITSIGTTKENTIVESFIGFKKPKKRDRSLHSSMNFNKKKLSRSLAIQKNNYNIEDVNMSILSQNIEIQKNTTADTVPYLGDEAYDIRLEQHKQKEEPDDIKITSVLEKEPQENSTKIDKKKLLNKRNKRRTTIFEMMGVQTETTQYDDGETKKKITDR